MNAYKAYLDLCRISNLPTVWTNILAASLLATGTVPSSLPLLILAGSCFYMGGMSLNDYCDVETDRKQKPTRPIPSGRVSIQSALIVSVMLFVGGLLLLATTPYRSSVVAGLILTSTIVAYDFYHKNNPFSVLLMAACRLLLFLVTALALTGSVSLLVLLCGSLQFIYVVLISLVARYENKAPVAFAFPVIPAMIACISLLDGSLMAALVAPSWFLAGLAGATLTWLGQRYVRGD